MRRSTVRRPRGQRGAAAVEGAILVLAVLAPLFSGVLYWGHYFWQAQRVSNLDVTGIPPGSVAGTYDCQQLLSRVTSLLGDNVSSLSRQLGVPTSAIGTVVRVVRVLPGIGVDVEVSVRVPVANELASLLPLPNNGAVLTVATQRLESVKVTTSSC